MAAGMLRKAQTHDGPRGCDAGKNFAHLQLVKRSARNWMQSEDATFKISATNTCVS